ncbi:hypothetical protein PPACK8108_LOCUS13306 [Phakopsora pachyrhizi]|uniref:Uncharacterized protein n=1 Tax=Phakopsora pachyrhizi TaxID=170000 RepID=A0AAV0B6F4_PHAPC|nr:hypothetical protein PPACK8108_LOCUS13306 [Phakopsora pachyrhizi]
MRLGQSWLVEIEFDIVKNLNIEVELEGVAGRLEQAGWSDPGWAGRAGRAAGRLVGSRSTLISISKGEVEVKGVDGLGGQW